MLERKSVEINEFLLKAKRKTRTCANVNGAFVYEVAMQCYDTVTTTVLSVGPTQ